MKRRSKRILARTSPSIIRSDPDDTTDTVSSVMTGVSTIPDSTHSDILQSDHLAHTPSPISNTPLLPCSVQLKNVLDFDDAGPSCIISKCTAKKCKTCDILITDPMFTSNLTNKSYHTRSYDDLNCKSTNIVYGLECNLCGLIYVGETKGELKKRIYGHRSGINNRTNKLIYQHFNQPDHSILSMKVRILEKIYHRTNNPNLATPLRRQKEDYWIRELGTATPYGCNDKIDGIGILSNPSSNSINVMNVFNNTPRRKRSHGHRHYTPPKFHDVSFNDLLPFIQKPLGIHHIRTKLYSLPRSKLHCLYNYCLNGVFTNCNSNHYKLSAIILDIAYHRLFSPVTTRHEVAESRSFLKLSFSNKGLDAIHLSNILHHKSVKSKIPPYFKDQSVPIISYTYTTPIASKVFNYKQVLHGLNIDDLKSKPPDCSCHNSPFVYNPAGHVITGDLNVVTDLSLRNVLAKGPKYREPKSINWKHNFKILMDSVEDYARQWAKREKEDVDTLSEWVKTVRSLIQIRINKLVGSMSTHSKSIFKDPGVAEHLSYLHDRYVVVPADKAPNNIVFICKAHYIECLMKELGINNSLGNPTYTPTALTKEEIIRNHRSVLSSFGIFTKDEELDLPHLFWIPKLHKCPYKQRYIAGSAKCSTKPLSKLLTSILTAIKDGLHSYCDTCYSRNGVNQMWILKNSKDLLDYIQSRSLSSCLSIKTFDFSTLYTTIPHSKLKDKLSELVRLCFMKKNGQRRYKYLVLGRDKPYFVKFHTDSTKKYTEDDIIRMLEFLIDNIYVVFGGRVFQQTVGIPMGTNCAPLLADLFLYSYEADFIQGLLKKNEKILARSFNFTFRYIDDVLSLNNPKFSDFVDRIYPYELEIKDTTETTKSASYLDLFLEIDNDGRLKTKIYDKRDDFSFPIVNFPFLSSNIPAAPAYGVYISQLIRYSRACISYQDFLERGSLLTTKLLNQGFLMVKLKSSLRKFYGRHHDLVGRYGISVSQMITDMFPLS